MHMRIAREFLGDRIIFPIGGVVGEGHLYQVDRHGNLLIREVLIEGKPAGDVLIPLPEWVRRVTGE